MGTPAAGLSGDVKARAHGCSVSCLLPLFWFGPLLLLPFEATCHPSCEVSLPSSQPGCLADMAHACRVQICLFTSCLCVCVGLCRVPLLCGFPRLRCSGFSLERLPFWSMGARASVLTARGLSGLGSWVLECWVNSCAKAQLLWGLWGLPGPGTEPISSALAGGYLTAELPGKSKFVSFKRHLLHFHHGQPCFQLAFEHRVQRFCVVIVNALIY